MEPFVEKYETTRKGCAIKELIEYILDVNE
jgi:hypothetical protein